VRRALLLIQEAESEEASYARRAKNICCGVLLALFTLSGCAELADVLLADVGHCHGCDWVVEIAEYNSWARTEAKTYHTEGVCQQALWHQSTKKPDRNYRCTNLDL